MKKEPVIRFTGSFYAILLVIGIVLAIFGLGSIGGLSALVGLIFIILGLLQQV